MSPRQFQQEILPFKDRLYRFACTFVGAADAQDVVQDVLLKAWEAFQQPDSIRNPEAWCMALTRNRSLDKLRKSGRHYEVVEEQTQLSSSDADPHRQAAAKETADRIHLMIAGLPEQQRAVIRLRDIEQYSYKEIAALLHLDVNYVKVLLHRARTRIRTQLTRVQRHGI